MKLEDIQRKGEELMREKVRRADELQLAQKKKDTMEQIIKTKKEITWLLKLDLHKIEGRLLELENPALGDSGQEKLAPEIADKKGKKEQLDEELQKGTADLLSLQKEEKILAEQVEKTEEASKLTDNEIQRK